MHKRDEIIETIKRCAEKLGRAPSQAEFRRASKISWYQIYKHFRGMRQAVRAAGLEPGPRGGALDINALTLDWASVVRKLGRLPSRAEYSEHGVHHAGTLHARIVWSQMAHKFVLLVREFHLEREWADVVKIVVGKFPLLEDLPQRTTEESTVAADWRRETQIGAVGRELTRMDTNENREPLSAQTGRPELLPLMATDNTDRQRGGMKLGKVVAAALAIEILMAAQRTQIDANQELEPQRAPVLLPPDDVGVAQGRLQNTEEMHELVDTDGAGDGQAPCGRPVVYGEPLGLAAMAHAPTNELGVLFLFGIMAAELGFRVERLQAAFPDCEAKREVAPGKWELVFIELEIYSRNFKFHRHNPRGCHAIVCWKHNWPDCPEWLEVIELSKLVKRLGDRA
ncbi:MAG TPA: hypothetical protein VGK21_00740 [Candidatus Angelobacter sp.]